MGKTANLNCTVRLDEFIYFELAFSLPQQKRPEASPRSQQRPLSEPVQPAGGSVEDHEDKDKKRKSMFSFLKKKKDKDHHEEHDKHKDSKKHKKDK